MLAERPFTELYIHIPFCMRKCDYCAFYSEGKMEESLLQKYMERLFLDMDKYASKCSALRSIYFGGGTPTLLPAEKMEKLFRKIRENFAFEKDIEITMECNADTLTEEKSSVMGTFVNRVSMGIQSFSPVFREKIGRKTGGGTGKSMEEILSGALFFLDKNNIRNRGIDLIYLLPGQTLSDWKKELQKAVSFDITHLSCYSLTLEEGTPLAEKYEEQDEDLSADMWELAGKFLGENSFSRYEISNYAKTGFHCRHNNNIWKGASYLGLGPSACSFNGKDRWTQYSPLAGFLEGKEAEKDVISDEKRLAEIFIMGLRKVSGWQEEDWSIVSGGISFDSFRKKEIERNLLLGLLQKEENRIFPTQKGLEYWNDLAESFL